MRKGLALLAICLAGMASAITVSWNGNEAVGVGTHTLSTKTNISTNPLSVSIVISGMKYTNWVATQTNTKLFTVYGKNGTGGADGITTTETGTPKSYFNVYVAANGELGWGIAGDGAGYASVSTGWKIVDLFNNSDTLTLTFNKTNRSKSGLSLAQQDGTSVALGTSTSNTFNFSSYDWDRITVTSLPEPGVMALLALGVAGLALRRKAS